jgi:hypothetical protein
MFQSTKTITTSLNGHMAQIDIKDNGQEQIFHARYVDDEYGSLAEDLTILLPEEYVAWDEYTTELGMYTQEDYLPERYELDYDKFARYTNDIVNWASDILSIPKRVLHDHVKPDTRIPEIYMKW